MELFSIKIRCTFQLVSTIVERTAAVCADIEGFAVFLYFLHDFLGT